MSIKNKNIYQAVVIALLSGLILISCSKSKSSYEVSYSFDDNSSLLWQSRNAQATIINDTVLINGIRKDDNSKVAIIIANNEVGNYPISINFQNGQLPSLNDLQTLVIINPDGSKDNKNNWASIQGNVSITANDKNKKILTGTFHVNAVKISNLLSTKGITGNFNVKYSVYKR